MTSTAPRVLPSDRSPDSEIARVRRGLVKLLPWLQGRARRQLPDHVLRRLASTPEDLVQLAAVAALARIETITRTTGLLPDWCRSEARLQSYLGGALWRMAMRLLRDHGASRIDPVDPEELTVDRRPGPTESLEEGDQARACLAVLTRDEIRLAMGFGMGKSYEELSRRLGASPTTLAKRRERILKRLRTRCLECSLRLRDGCDWVPPDWV
jgi:DNA-directed RNA polymerase specialized sigma24 family protein